MEHPDITFTAMRGYAMPTVRMAIRGTAINLSPSQLVALHLKTEDLIRELTAEVNHLTSALEREARNKAGATDDY